MKVRHQIDESILLAKPRQVIAVAAVVAAVAAGVVVTAPSHDTGRKMLHDGWRVTQPVS